MSAVKFKRRIPKKPILDKSVPDKNEDIMYEDFVGFDLIPGDLSCARKIAEIKRIVNAKEEIKKNRQKQVVSIKTIRKKRPLVKIQISNEIETKKKKLSVNCNNDENLENAQLLKTNIIVTENKQEEFLSQPDPISQKSDETVKVEVSRNQLNETVKVEESPNQLDDTEKLEESPNSTENSLENISEDPNDSKNVPNASVVFESEPVLVGSKKGDDSLNSTAWPISKPCKKFSPKYYEPFKYGFKRLLVPRYNSTPEKPQHYVYYCPPDGPRLRSISFVKDYLIKNNIKLLSVENFTFVNDVLTDCSDPDIESISPRILENPKKNGRLSTNDTENQETNELSPSATTPQSKPLKRMRKSAVFTPKIVRKGVRRTKLEIAAANFATLGSDKKHESADEFQIGTFPPGWSQNIPEPKKSPTLSTTNKPTGRAVCSVQCPLARGKVPMLQCSSCVCLFHHECFGLVDDGKPILGFICKNCRQKRKSGLAAPSEAPVSIDLPSTDASKGQISNLKPATLTATPVTTTAATSTSSKPQKIVDGVTTWLPSSSNIQITSTTTAKKPITTTASSLDSVINNIGQSLVSLNGKIYIAVAKRSIMSIIPSSDIAKDGLPAKISDDSTKKTTANQKSSSDVHTVIGESNDLSSSEMNISKSASSADELNSGPSLNTSPDQRIKDDTDNDVSSGSNNAEASSNTGVVLVPCSPSTRCNIMMNDENGADLSQKSSDMENIPPRNSFYDLMQATAYIDNSDDESEDGDVDRGSRFNTASDFSMMFNFLIKCFSYLKVGELLKVAQTNRFFYRLSTDKNLWSTVKLKNSRVYDWEGCCRMLNRRGTKELDMRKMLMPSKIDEIGIMWTNFIRAISGVPKLERIDLCRCNTYVIDSIAIVCPQLKVLNALYIGSGEISFSSIGEMVNLTELRLRGISSVVCNDELNFIEGGKLLTVLSLTNIKNLDIDMLGPLSAMNNLETLELGDCGSLLKEPKFLDMITGLKKLQKLRFEKILDIHPDYRVFKVISELDNLKTLELINIEVKPGFNTSLSLCKNLQELLIIPLYATQSATTNRLILNAVKGLSNNLKLLVWGLTLELFKMTNLFMMKHGQDPMLRSNDVEGSNKKNIDGNVPVLKSPEKPILDADTSSNGGGQVPAQIDILSTNKLESLLRSMLPNTEVKLIKILFTATWRQNLSDCLKR